MKESHLIFKFKTQDDLEDFTAWFLDGGGEDSFAEFCEDRNADYLNFSFNKDKNAIIAD